MRDGPVAERRLDRLVDDIDDVIRPGDALVVGSDVHIQLVEIDVLLIVRADQIVEGMAGDGKYGLPVALRIVEAVEQVNAAGAGCGETDPQTAGIFRVAAGGEGRGLFVPYLDEADLLLVCPQGLENSVYAVAGKPKYRIDAPFDQALDQ